jgi:hypothetical protein
MLWHGVFLFLIGLVTGTQQRRFINMRMALSAHLEGVMNGTFLMAFGRDMGRTGTSAAHSASGTMVGALRHLWQLAVHHPRRRARHCRR